MRINTSEVKLHQMKHNMSRKPITMSSEPAVGHSQCNCCCERLVLIDSSISY